jgi:hypothetical protein
MKTIVLFILGLLFGLHELVWSQYQAAVRQQHWAFQAGPGNEWEGELYADLYWNGQLVGDNPSLTYKWYRKWPDWQRTKCFQQSIG